MKNIPLLPHLSDLPFPSAPSEPCPFIVCRHTVTHFVYMDDVSCFLRRAFRRNPAITIGPSWSSNYSIIEAVQFPSGLEHVDVSHVFSRSFGIPFVK